jgi:hypothetical protein
MVFEALGDYENATIAYQQSLNLAQQRGDRAEKVLLKEIWAACMPTLVSMKGDRRADKQFGDWRKLRVIAKGKQVR